MRRISEGQIKIKRSIKMEKESMEDEKSVSNGYADSIAKKRFFLVFLLGILLGVIIKAQAINHVTIGFEDYKLKSSHEKFDFLKKEEVIEENQAPAPENGEGVIEDGEVKNEETGQGEEVAQ